MGKQLVHVLVTALLNLIIYSNRNRKYHSLFGHNSKLFQIRDILKRLCMTTTVEEV